ATIVALCTYCAALPAKPPATTRPATAQAAIYGSCTPSADGIGKTYMGREIAQVMGHEAADWLDRPQREEEEAPKMLVQIMRLRPTDIVADIGAGSGHLTFLMAPKVSQGKVLAEDIQPEMLDLIHTRAKEKGVNNVEPILGTIT